MSETSGGLSRKEIETVFLDRDGVINEKRPEGNYVSSVTEFELLPGVPEAIARLNQAGIRVLVVSNQRGVALGIMSEKDIQDVHQYLRDQLEKHNAHLDGIYYCPHDRNSCTCRKPLPGLFQQSARDFPGLRAETSIMIGDSLSDIQFGSSLGMRTIWISGDSKLRKPGWQSAGNLADFTSESLSAAVAILLDQVSG